MEPLKLYERLQNCYTSLEPSERNKVMILLAVDRMRGCLQNIVMRVAENFHNERSAVIADWKLNSPSATEEDVSLKIKEIWGKFNWINIKNKRQKAEKVITEKIFSATEKKCQLEQKLSEAKSADKSNLIQNLQKKVDDEFCL